MKAYNIIVKGRVQRVGYRRYLLDIAQELGLMGYVKNREDGAVQIFVQGSEDVLNTFLERAKNPEYPAKVLNMEIEEAGPNPEYKHFAIKFGSFEEELQEGFGAMQAIFMDYWREFRNYRNEFKDYRNEFRDFAKRTDENFNRIMEKYGEISEKLTQILNTLIEESRRSKEMLERVEKDSRETRQMLTEAMNLLKQAIEKLSAPKDRA